MSHSELLSKIKEDNVNTIILQFSDIHGLMKGFTIPAHKVEDAIRYGVWFDGSSIEGFTRIFESDMYLKPDIATYGVVGWIEGNGGKVARMICDVYMPDGTQFVGDPRYVLKRVVDEARKEGYVYKTGVELEFFLFNRSNTGEIALGSAGNGYYFNADTPPLTKIKEEILKSLAGLNIEVELSHTEVAQNQHEIDFKYADALITADNAMTFKFVVKSIAQMHGMHATFMPKPIFGVNGSGMHTHQSLASVKDDTNLFYDGSDSYNLSAIAKKFIAGLLKHSKEFSAVIAPTVNSYKRLTPGYEAPVYVCWAERNRSALVRVPRTFKEQSAVATRCELRCPDPSTNPYLAFAVMLKAGLDGIKRKLTPPEPVEEDVYEFDETALTKHKIDTLPGSLSEAMLELNKNKVIQEALGPHTYPLYIKAKKVEYDEYRLQVTKWEMDKYFEST